MIYRIAVIINTVSLPRILKAIVKTCPRQETSHTVEVLRNGEIMLQTGKN